MQRELKVGLIVGLIAGLILVGGMVTLALINRDLRGQVHNLRIQQQEVAEDATGGAEVPVPDPVEVQDARWLFPIASEDFLRYTSPSGYRVSPILHVEKYHTGIDIAGVWRAQVVAVADGVVTDHWPIGTWGGKTFKGHPIYGWYIEIEHEDGLRTRYAHLSSSRMNVVHIGARVRAGEPIGRVGNTGQSVSPHLHFEIIAPDGKSLNPLLYIQEPEKR